MKQLDYQNSRYHTQRKPINLVARLFPSFWFYCRFIGIVFHASGIAKRDKYDWKEWNDSSFDTFKTLESAGCSIEITGVENIRKLDSPCVIIGNHMSFLESVLLPVIILPFLKVTFIIKESLLNYPVFKHVIRSRNPIAVTRTNPRLDFKAVMNQGVERLQKGISVIVFPQTTRSHKFNPEQLSTLGVKLAKKAGVPIVPLALRTDALKNGKFFKDFGKLDPERKVLFSFGRPLEIKGRGAEEHQEVLAFISSQLDGWRQKKDEGRGLNRTIKP